MTIQEGWKFVQEHTDVIKNYWLLPHYSDDRQDSAWYGGTVLKFLYKNRYTVYVDAAGDTEGWIYKIKNHSIERNEDWRDRNNSGRLGELLEEFGATKDSEIYFDENFSPEEIEDAPEGCKAAVAAHYNNWFEINIYDNQERRWIELSLINVIDNIFDVFDLQWIEDIITL